MRAYTYTEFISLFRPTEPVRARKFTQILFVVAISFGCYIHGTSVSYPSVLTIGLEETNKTERRASNESADENDTEVVDYWGDGLFPEALPFFVYGDDIALIGAGVT